MCTKADKPEMNPNQKMRRLSFWSDVRHPLQADLRQTRQKDLHQNHRRELVAFRQNAGRYVLEGMIRSQVRLNDTGEHP